MQIALLVDSATRLDLALIKKYNITVIPVPVEIGGVRYYEGSDLNLEQYQELVADNQANIAQIRVTELTKRLELLGEQGYDTVLGLCPASGLSTLFSHLQACNHEIDNLNVYAFDTQVIGPLQGQFVQAAAELIASGDEIHTILRKLGRMRQQLQTFIALEDLTVLQNQGYVSNGKKFPGKNLLPLKTLCSINDTSQLEVMKTRLRSKQAYTELQSWIYTSYDRLEERMQITIIGAYDNDDFYDYWVPNLRQDFPKAKLVFAPLGISTTIRLGTKSILVSFGPSWREFLSE